MSVDRIRADLRAGWADLPIGKLSLAIVDYVARLPAEQRAFLTYSALMRGVGKSSIDDELMAAITLLVSSSIAALDFRGLLIDDDEREFSLTQDDLAQATKIGELFHPETGNSISNFEEKVVPFFVPSARFLAAE